MSEKHWTVEPAGAVLVLQEHVGAGVRVRGVFHRPADAASAARKLAEKAAWGTGRSASEFMQRYVISTFAIGVLNEDEGAPIIERTDIP